MGIKITRVVENNDTGKVSEALINHKRTLESALESVLGRMQNLTKNSIGVSSTVSKTFHYTLEDENSQLVVATAVVEFATMPDGTKTILIGAKGFLNAVCV